FSYSASHRGQRSSACVGGITKSSRLCGARPLAGRRTTSTSSSIQTRKCPMRSTTVPPTTGVPSLAIADLAGGEWPQLARQACLTLSGESAEEAMGVMLLAHCREAFGREEVVRSVDLVTKLAADPERPWAEYNRGNPITQRQVARLLGAFGIISVNVNPPQLA